MRSHTFCLNDLRQYFRQLYYQKLTGHKITERTPKRSSKVVKTKWAQNEWILTITRIERDLKLNLVTRMYTVIQNLWEDVLLAIMVNGPSDVVEDSMTLEVSWNSSLSIHLEKTSAAVRTARIHVDFLLAIMSIMETEYTKSCLIGAGLPSHFLRHHS